MFWRLLRYTVGAHKLVSAAGATIFIVVGVYDFMKHRSNHSPKTLRRFE
jgi:hypothetical protein